MKIMKNAVEAGMVRFLESEFDTNYYTEDGDKLHNPLHNGYVTYVTDIYGCELKYKRKCTTKNDSSEKVEFIDLNKFYKDLKKTKEFKDISNIMPTIIESVVSDKSINLISLKIPDRLYDLTDLPGRKEEVKKLFFNLLVNTSILNTEIVYSVNSKLYIWRAQEIYKRGYLITLPFSIKKVKLSYMSPLSAVVISVLQDKFNLYINDLFDAIELETKPPKWLSLNIDKIPERFEVKIDENTL